MKYILYVFTYVDKEGYYTAALVTSTYLSRVYRMGILSYEESCFLLFPSLEFIGFKQLSMYEACSSHSVPQQTTQLGKSTLILSG